ncbi:hypothetical protein FY534_14300 (plasmid) [Alicyclobacillus sp. TC]|uniref:hypothetical protein n=1 Tax=Alicyclobacillus sp. TC TaxID=2606450 RepID=UPI0019316808|nr:hypothetical protein [Alicyclobacillus sp. TC]QRF24941.1 hypothetical protein FY534_14300 [Alicyclobacillus sp. TC]
MQKRIWGLTASMLALTCLTVTGCGTHPSFSDVKSIDNSLTNHQQVKNIHYPKFKYKFYHNQAYGFSIDFPDNNGWKIGAQPTDRDGLEATKFISQSFSNELGWNNVSHDALILAVGGYNVVPVSYQSLKDYEPKKSENVLLYKPFKTSYGFTLLEYQLEKNNVLEITKSDYGEYTSAELSIIIPNKPDYKKLASYVLDSFQFSNPTYLQSKTKESQK